MRALINRSVEPRMLVLGTAILVAFLVVMLTVSPEQASAAFPGQNGKIAYVRWDGTDREIYTANSDGSDGKQLTDNTVNDDSPAWSPNGKRIAFVSNREGKNLIYVMKADGSGVRKVTDAESYDPAWSPSGKKIVYVKGDDLYTKNVDGTGAKRLTRTDYRESSPDWDPGGKRIAYARDSGSIRAITPKGTNGGRIVGQYIRAHLYTPDFSPNGKKLVYHERGFGDDFPTAQLWVESLRTGHRWPIAHGFEPVFSPDGTKVAFGGSIDGIFVQNSNGTGEAEKIIDGGSWPDWQPLVP